MESIPAAARKTTATIATVIHELVLVSGALLVTFLWHLGAQKRPQAVDRHEGGYSQPNANRNNPSHYHGSALHTRQRRRISARPASCSSLRWCTTRTKFSNPVEMEQTACKADDIYQICTFESIYHHLGSAVKLILVKYPLSTNCITFIGTKNCTPNPCCSNHPAINPPCTCKLRLTI
jgi:hypothetical protein